MQYGLKLTNKHHKLLEDAAWAVVNTVEARDMPPTPKELEARMVLTTRMIESIFMFGEIDLDKMEL